MKAASQERKLKNPRRPRRSLALRGWNASLTGKDRLIPGTEYLTFTLQIVTAGPFALPSFMQQLGPQFADRGRVFKFHVAEHAESLANRARDAKFPGR